MHSNKIKTFRAKEGLSQKNLAELVGTSQQQIQRIETGKQAIRIDLATKVCNALGGTMETIFPKAGRILRRAQKSASSNAEMLGDSQLEEELDKAGVEIDPTIWYFQYRLRGSAEGILQVSRRVHSELWDAVQRQRYETFVTFEAGGSVILLNLDHLVFCHTHSPLATVDGTRPARKRNFSLLPQQLALDQGARWNYKPNLLTNSSAVTVAPVSPLAS